ncbi:ATP-binding protein [Intestinibacter sp.]
MSYNIAVAGKGGTGKTSLTGLLIDHLTKVKKGDTLVVDADANSNLNDVLGIEYETTIGDIKDKSQQIELSKEAIPGGMSRAQYIDYQLNQIMAEGDGYDLLVMGRSDGEGCYCFVNSILKRQLQLMSNHYDYLVIDNEAGMEHLSRKTITKLDDLLLISDCSARSIEAVARIKDLAEKMRIEIARVFLIINKAPSGELNDGVKKEIEKFHLNLIGVVPMDEQVFEYDSNRIPLVNLPEDSKAKVAIREIFEKLNI